MAVTGCDGPVPVIQRHAHRDKGIKKGGGTRRRVAINERERMTDRLSWYVAWQQCHWPVCIGETSLSVKLLEEKGHI